MKYSNAGTDWDICRSGASSRRELRSMRRSLRQEKGQSSDEAGDSSDYSQEGEHAWKKRPTDNSYLRSIRSNQNPSTYSGRACVTYQTEKRESSLKVRQEPPRSRQSWVEPASGLPSQDASQKAENSGHRCGNSLQHMPFAESSFVQRAKEEWGRPQAPRRCSEKPDGTNTKTSAGASRYQEIVELGRLIEEKLASLTCSASNVGLESPGDFSQPAAISRTTYGPSSQDSSMSTATSASHQKSVSQEAPRLPPLLRKMKAPSEEEIRLLKESVVVQRSFPDGNATVKKSYPEGEYEGQINSAGKREGQGIMRYKNGGLYEGQYRNDKKNGWGKYSSPKGEEYIGEVKNGRMEGKGWFCTPNGNWHHGIFRKGRLEGDGLCYYSDGAIYRGKYVRGKPDGYGTHYSADGKEIYEGNFRKGKRHGQGKICRSMDGVVTFEGKFENGMRLESGGEGYQVDNYFLYGSYDELGLKPDEGEL